MKTWRARLRLLTLAGVVALCLTPASALALDIPSKPTDIPVVDQTSTLSSEQKQALAGKIAAERTSTGNEIGILMVKSLDGDAIEDYAVQVARQWGVGQKDRNSGVLLLVAKDDRKLRIEVGYGLEGALPDITASRIIEQRITPEFKQGKYYEGINSGLDGIVLAIHGEADPSLGKSTKSTSAKALDFFGQFFWVIFVIPIWVGSILARSKSWWAGGVIGGIGGVVVGLFFGFLFFGVGAIVIMALLGLLLDKTVSDNYQKAASKRGNGPPSWWAGGPWLGGGPGGSSGGGFGGFSGGSFGGGGSSGSW